MQVGNYITIVGDNEITLHVVSLIENKEPLCTIPVGVLLQGDISRGGFWQQLIANKTNIAALSESVWKTSFADGYALDESGEYVWRLPEM